MKQRVSGEQLSALQFERVWVREATFIDNEGDQTLVPQQAFDEVEIQLEAKAVYSERGDRAFVTLRASLESPPKTRLFVKLAAAVEGTFSVRAGTDPQRLQRFATVQAPVLLMPYLREVITKLTAQSRLGALVIPPLNMAEIMKEMQSQAAEKPNATPATP